MTKSGRNQGDYEYIITETGMPISYDPLDADVTRNLPVARMLYATPLEISADNELTSSILENFQYFPESRKIVWKVKENAVYSNGNALRPEDVAFAVARMAFTRPRFPVIENIVGLEDWLKEPNPLDSFPSGIQVQGSEITITLDKSLKHPLFRFCLELFSVIPKDCIDQKTNKMICERPASSGPYTLTASGSDFLQFDRRHANDSDKPPRIRFTYLPANQLGQRLSEISDNAIVAASEGSVEPDILKRISSEFHSKFLPAARMMAFLLNPQSSAFQDQKCRWTFAQDLRTEIGKFERGLQFESSLFTKIVPGYLAYQDLINGSSFKNSSSIKDSCRKGIASSKLKWGYAKGEELFIFSRPMRALLSTYHLQIDPILFASRKEVYSAFENGEVDVVTAGAGFWAADPVGDLKMLFTPNLHKILSHVSRDPGLQELLKNLEQNQSTERLQEMNQYIFDQSLFNVFLHVRRFYFSKDHDLLKEVPFAITSPAPWQVFNL